MRTRNEREESSMNTKCRCGHQWLTKLSKRGVRGAVALLLLLPVAAWAGGVVTNCTEAALRAAMAGGGAVAFACDGTITLAGTITNNIDLTLDGSGHQVTISGSNAVRVFYVNTNVTFTAVNLTIAAASSLGGSAILNLGGNVNLTGVTFRSNTATPNGSLDQLIPQASGGAIFNRGGTVNASNCSFVGNSAQIPVAYSFVFHEQVYGGAIRNESGQVDLRSCAFVGNRASGGALSPGGYANAADPAGASPLPRTPEIAKAALEATGAYHELERFDTDPVFRDRLSARVAEHIKVLRRKITDRGLVRGDMRLSDEVVVRVLIEHGIITTADLGRLNDPAWCSRQEDLWWTQAP